MMEEQERLRLKKEYEEMPEEKLIEVILEDEKEYKRQPYEAYELLLEEAKRRGIEKKIEERKKFNKNKEHIGHKDIDLIVVKKFLYRQEAEIAKGLLTSNGIESIISADDAGGWRPEIAFGKGGVHLLVKKGDLQKVKETLKVLEDTAEGQQSE